MPVYMDIHRNLPEVSPDELRRYHLADLEAQDRFGVRYLRAWVNREAGEAFCLVDAPNEQSAVDVHRCAHGQLPDKLVPVEPELVTAFLGESSTAADSAVHPEGGIDTGFRAVLVTELDYTAIAQGDGQVAGLEAMRAHDRIVRGVLGEHGGREVSHSGVGMLCSLPSVARALECARRIQRTAAGHEPVLEIQMGLAAGEPVDEGDQLFGVTVQVARRLCERAEPGRILVSNAVRELSAASAAGRDLAERGEARLKGFSEPVRVHELRWREEAASTDSDARLGLERRLSAILSMDVVGYSRHMAEDELGTLRALLDCRALVDRIVARHRGRVVDAPGDNVLAELGSAHEAAQCAAEVQRALRSHPLDLRIGLHLGDVVAEGPRIYGDGVNVAARLEALAEPGGLCLSGAVCDQVAGKLDLPLEDLGEREVKNFPRPVRVYRARV